MTTAKSTRPAGARVSTAALSPTPNRAFSLYRPNSFRTIAGRARVALSGTGGVRPVSCPVQTHSALDRLRNVVDAAGKAITNLACSSDLRPLQIGDRAFWRPASGLLFPAASHSLRIGLYRRHARDETIHLGREITFALPSKRIRRCTPVRSHLLPGPLHRLQAGIQGAPPRPEEPGARSPAWRARRSRSSVARRLACSLDGNCPNARSARSR